MDAKSKVDKFKTEVKPKLTFSILFNSFKEHFNLLYVVFKKTLFIDLFNRWKFIFAIIFMIFLPVFYITFFPMAFLDDQTSLNEQLGMFHIMYSYMTVLPFLLIFSSASLISEEIKSGTMLLLVSKPISRGEIVCGKFIATLFYNLIIGLISLGLVCLFAFLKHPFFDIIPFFWTQFLLSLLVIIFFGTLTMGLSMTFRNIKTSALVPLMLLLVLIFLFLIVRSLLMSPTPYGDPYYEAFQIYNFDLGYHIMNIYSWLYESLISQLPQGMTMMLRLWGVYKIEYDPETPLIEIYTKTHYQLPQISLLIMLVFAAAVMIIGFLIFKKRDIN